MAPRGVILCLNDMLTILFIQLVAKRVTANERESDVDEEINLNWETVGHSEEEEKQWKAKIKAVDKR